VKEYSQKENSAKQSLQETTVNDKGVSELSENVGQKSAKNESYLLAKLIGRQEQNQSEREVDFWLNLGTDESVFNDSIEETNPNQNELNLIEGIHKNKSLENIINDLNIDVNEGNNCSNNDDLLALMDS
jgi:hypothetical protein